MAASTTRSARFLRALPTLAQLILGIAGLASRNEFLMVVGMVLVGSVVFRNWRHWWTYVLTGERATGAWTVDPRYASPGELRVSLIAAGGRPIEVIKAVREIAGADLLGAKILVEGVPSIIVDRIDRPSAEAAQQLLAEAGAKAVIEAATAR